MRMTVYQVPEGAYRELDKMLPCMRVDGNGRLEIRIVEDTIYLSFFDDPGEGVEGLIDTYALSASEFSYGLGVLSVAQDTLMVGDQNKLAKALWSRFPTDHPWLTEKLGFRSVPPQHNGAAKPSGLVDLD